MDQLSANNATLQAAMMGTIGAIWAIGLAPYQFIYKDFEERHLPGIEKVKMYIKSRGEGRINSGMAFESTGA